MIYINCMRIVQWLLGWVALGALVGCGGGGGGGGNVQDTSPSGFMAFASQQDSDFSYAKSITYDPTGQRFLMVTGDVTNGIPYKLVTYGGDGLKIVLVTMQSGGANPVNAAVDSATVGATVYVSANFNGTYGTGELNVADGTGQAINALTLTADYSGMEIYNGYAYVADGTYVNLGVNYPSISVVNLANGNKTRVYSSTAGDKSKDIARSAAGYFFFSAPASNKVYYFADTVTNGVVTNAFTDALFNQPAALATDESSNLYVLNDGDGKILKVSNPTNPGRTITEYINTSGLLCSPVGLAYRSGYIYTVNSYSCNDATKKGKVVSIKV